MLLLITTSIMAVCFFKRKRKVEDTLFRQNCYGDYKGNIKNPYAESDLSSTITKSENEQM